MFTQVQQNSIENASAAQRRSKAIETFGNYGNSLLPWDWFATVTLPRVSDRAKARSLIRGCLRELEREAGQPIGWMLVVETGEVGGHYHAHFLISSVSHLSRRDWWQKTFDQFGRSEIRKFQKDGRAPYYLAKNAVTGSRIIYLGGGLLCQGNSIKRLYVGLSKKKLAALQDVRAATGSSVRGQKRPRPELSIDIYGSGGSWRHRDSWCGYYNTDTHERDAFRRDGASRNQATVFALTLALEEAPFGSNVDIGCSVELIVHELNGKSVVRNEMLKLLLERPLEAIRKRDLKVRSHFVVKDDNQAHFYPPGE